MPNYKAELVGVFGHPVAENPTVVMQEAAFNALSLNWRYLTIEVLPEDLGAAMQALRALNMQGINLTIPHKVAVLDHLDEISEAAALMGAVNTVKRDGRKLFGENTDGKGFMTSLEKDAGIDPKGMRIVLLGAGGAARAIAVELALAGAAHITLVNRSADRGSALAELINRKTPAPCDFVQWKGTFAIPAGTHILVNATSIGLAPDVNARPDIDYNTVTAGMTVCDVIPTPVTPFLLEAGNRGAEVVDGLGMLVYQGAIGFKMWTGLDAPIQVMADALTKAFRLD